MLAGSITSCKVARNVVLPFPEKNLTLFMSLNTICTNKSLPIYAEYNRSKFDNIRSSNLKKGKEHKYMFHSYVIG